MACNRGLQLKTDKNPEDANQVSQGFCNPGFAIKYATSNRKTSRRRIENKSVKNVNGETVAAPVANRVFEVVRRLGGRVVKLERRIEFIEKRLEGEGLPSGGEFPFELRRSNRQMGP